MNRKSILLTVLMLFVCYGSLEGLFANTVSQINQIVLPGDTLFKDGKYVEALKVYQENIDFYRQMKVRYHSDPQLFNKYMRMLALCHERAGDCYMKMGEPELALSSYYKAAYQEQNLIPTTGSSFSDYYSLLSIKIKKATEYMEILKKGPEAGSRELNSSESSSNSASGETQSGNSSGSQSHSSESSENSSDASQPENNSSTNNSRLQTNPSVAVVHNASSTNFAAQEQETLELEAMRLLSSIDKQLGLPENQGSSENVYRSLMNATDLSPEYEVKVMEMVDKLESINDLEKARQLLIKLAQMQQKANNETGLSLTYYRIGLTHESVGDWEAATMYYDKSLALNLGKDNQAVLGILYTRIGFNLVQMGQIDSALKVYEKSLPYLKLNNQKELLAEANFQLGTLYQNTDNLEKALQSYTVSLELNQERHDSRIIGIIYYNIGSVYLQQNRHDKALISFRQSLDFLNKVNASEAIQVQKEIQKLETILSNKDA